MRKNSAWKYFVSIRNKPGQKGAVENANKILREYFPKGTDFRRVTQAELNKVQFQINERPRKKLNFSTPKIELFRRIC